MKNVVKRALTAAAIVIVMVGAVLLSPWLFLILFFVINILGLNEFYGLVDSTGVSPRRILGIILSGCLFITSSLITCGISDWKILLTNIPVLLIIFISELYLRAKNPFENLALTFLGIIYVTLPLTLFVAIAFLPAEDGVYHAHIILGYLFIMWANDTGAYFTGKYFGKHPLFKRISPKKTMEGSAGGFLFALLIAYIISLWFREIDLSKWLIIAFIIIVTGTFGDLVKSLLKRSLGIKDSGTILPGHGGILDRFDSLLGSAPFVFSYLVLFWKG